MVSGSAALANRPVIDNRTLGLSAQLLPTPPRKSSKIISWGATFPEAK
jgi:hypothetical protein